MLEIVIPLFKVNWITKAVLESLNLHYNPRKIHIISVKKLSLIIINQYITRIKGTGPWC